MNFSNLTSRQIKAKVLELENLQAKDKRAIRQAWNMRTINGGDSQYDFAKSKERDVRIRQGEIDELVCEYVCRQQRRFSNQ